MSLPNYTDFIALFPMFSDLDQPFVELWLEKVKLEISSKVFGNLYSMATYYLLAHSLTVYRLTNASGGIEKGAVTSESEGDFSVSYATAPMPSSSDSSNYSSTSFGREYLSLRKKVVVGLSGIGTP